MPTIIAVCRHEAHDEGGKKCTRPCYEQTWYLKLNMYNLINRPTSAPWIIINSRIDLRAIKMYVYKLQQIACQYCKLKYNVYVA